MLSCKEVTDRASALIDRDLSAWRVLQIRLHLALCKSCSLFVRQMLLTDRLTAQVAVTEEPLPHEAEDGRFTEILSMLRKERSRPGREISR